MDPSGRTMPNGVDVKAVATSLRSSRHTAKQRAFLCKKVMTLLFVDNDTVNVPRALKVQWYEFRSFSGATLHGLIPELFVGSWLSLIELLMIR
jgi:hypothetical protein